MIVLLRRLTETWSTARRARLLYVAMAAGFAALAIAGIVLGDALVAVVAAIVAVLTAALAVVAPRLTASTTSPDGIHELAASELRDD